MRNDFKYHPVCKVLPLWMIYRLSAKGVGKLMNRRDKPVPNALTCH